jgi:hypothetical protein
VGEVTVLLLLIFCAASLVPVCWNLASAAILAAQIFGREPSELARTVRAELRPFYWPAIVAYTALAITAGMSPVKVGFLVGIWTLTWFTENSDDDDRWKRRRKKLAERVSVAAGRLQVVPATGGAS